MKAIHDYLMITPNEVAAELACRVRALRLAREWKQSTLAENAGVTLASLRRFERTGKISLQSLLKLSFALGRLSDYEGLLHPLQATSLAELEARSSARRRKRGSR